MVSAIWMPATMAIWVISCWAAPAIPRFSSSTALATLAAIEGDDTPSPTPASMSAPMTARFPAPGSTVVHASMDATTARVPTIPAVRSPRRTARYPATGAVSENDSGRAIDRSPILVSP